MKHLERFFNYIVESTESNEFSEEYLEELLVPMSDIGIKGYINKTDGLINTVTKGEFKGRGYINITFNLSDLEHFSGDDEFGRHQRMITDDKFWDFLDEFITFKNRLETDKIAVYFNTNSGGHFYPFFSISFLVPGDFKSDIFELEKAYDILRRRSNVGTTEFYYNLIIKLNKEEKFIDIRVSDSYTDRKFNNFMSGVDTSKFNIEKDVQTKGVWKKANIKITLKE